MSDDDYFTILVLTDRRDGEKFIGEIEQSYKKLTDFYEALAKHMRRGRALMETVERAKRFFSLQLRDATVVEDVTTLMATVLPFL